MSTLPAVVRVLVSITLLGIACVTDPCVCPPATSAVVVYGRVQRRDGGPVASALVSVFLADQTCTFPAAAFIQGSATTGPDGSFATGPIVGSAGGGPACLRVTAATDSTSAPIATLEGVLTRFSVVPGHVDSVGVVLEAP